MRILFDTNIILDVLLDRQPFADAALDLFVRVENGQISGYLCASTITTIHYLASKVLDSKEASSSIEKLMGLFEIAPVQRIVLQKALKMNLKDFEDAVLYQAGVEAGVQGLVTRDIKGFKQAEISVFSPEEFIRILESIT